MAAVMLMTSCLEEDLVNQSQAGALSTVSINVTTPELGVATRAFGDGTTSQTLHYAVYNVKGEGESRTRTYLEELTEEKHPINLSTTVDLQLVTGNTYDIIFWADADGNEPYSIDWENATVSVDYTGVTSNNENYDAFFNWITIEVKGAQTESVELYRPFGQLNIGTSDIEEARKAGFDLVQTSVTVPVYKTLNLWTKAVSGEQTVTFGRADIPTGETFPVSGYEYMAMNYLLLPADKELVDVTFDFYSTGGEQKNRVYSSVPVQRNWRTNIYGQLITSEVDINVEIVPGFDDAYSYFKEVATAEDLQAAVNSATGEEPTRIVLTEDITLENTLVIGGASNTRSASCCSIIFDGNGKTLTYTGSGEGARAIDVKSESNGANLTLKNVTIDCTASYCQRGINYNTTGALVLDGVTVKGKNVTYALNLPGSSDGAQVTINNSSLTANIALNVWGENAVINATASNFTSVDNTSVENYSAVVLNNDGTTSAEGTTVTINGGSVTALDENGDPSDAFSNSTATGKIILSESTTVIGNYFKPVANVYYSGTDQFYSCATLQDAIDKAIETKALSVSLIKDVELEKPVLVAKEGNVTLDLNGHTISTGLEEEGRHYYALNNNGTLKIEGEGNIYARGIKNFGTMVVDGDVTITNIDTNGGAAIWNEGQLTINNGTFTTNADAGAGSYGAAVNTRQGGSATINGGVYEVYSQLTYAIVNEGTTTIYDATVKGRHGAISGSESGNTTIINGGTFELMDNPGVSDHCAYFVSEIKGGKFTLGNNTDSGAQVFYNSTIAEGYEAVEVNGWTEVVAKQ